MAQMVKRTLIMRKTRVQSLGQEEPLGKEMATHSSILSLGQEEPLGKEMATHSSILAWKIPWTEEPGRLQSMGSQRAGHA